MDISTQADVRMIRLKKKYGAAGSGVYWELTLRLRQLENYSLHRDDLVDILEDLWLDPSSVEIVDYCIEQGLFTEEAGILSCPYLLERMQEYESICETNRANRLKQNQKTTTEQRPITMVNGGVTPVDGRSTTVNARGTPVNDANIIYNNIYNNKNSTEALELPETVGPKLRKALLAWRGYLLKEFRKDFGAIEVEALLMAEGHDQERIAKGIYTSIRSKWKNIVFDSGSIVRDTKHETPRPQPKEFVPLPVPAKVTGEKRQAIADMVAKVAKAKELKGGKS